MATERAKEVTEQWLEPNLNYTAGGTNTWAVDGEASHWVPVTVSLHKNKLSKQPHPPPPSQSVKPVKWSLKEALALPETQEM